VKVATLFGQGLDGVVSAPEVGDEDARKQRAEYLFDDFGAAAAIDEVVAELAGCESPQPEGQPIDAPARLVGMQHGAVADLLPDGFVLTFEKRGQALPRQRQSARADWKSQGYRGSFHAVSHTDSHAIMKPSGIDHEAQSQARVLAGPR
jgi:hypothetical protein